jgi:hypothetical protein
MKNKGELENIYSEILNESSLSRLWDETQKHSCGTISAFRGDRIYQENDLNHKKLVAYLLSKGYSFTKIDGTYIENFGSNDEEDINERSLFVCNHNVEGGDGGELEEDLFKMGEYFNQDSVLIIPLGGEGAYLFRTSKRDNAYPSYGQKEIVGNGRYGKVAGQFLSKIQGRSFAYEHIEKPQTVNGWRGIDILLREFEEL